MRNIAQGNFDGIKMVISMQEAGERPNVDIRFTKNGKEASVYIEFDVIGGELTPVVRLYPDCGESSDAVKFHLFGDAAVRDFIFGILP